MQTGRGTGKTTVLEFIRYILGLMPDPDEDKPRAKAVEGGVRGNLGSGTAIAKVVAISRNHRSVCVGSSGRNGPDQRVEITGMRRRPSTP